LQNWWFVIGTTLSTYLVFVISLAAGLAMTGGDLRPATIQAVLGSYSNIGYMGPGLTLAAIGPAAAVPTALIFVFDNAMLFALIPFLIALGGDERLDVWKTTKMVIWRIVSHPFNIATFAGVVGAYFQLRPPVAIDKIVNYLAGSAAPVALFALGVTVAQRPIRRVPHEIGFMLAIKLLLHPVLVFVVLNWIGGFDRVWVMTATLMASLPPALNVFVIARQYNVYVERASSTVLIGTVVSVVTVTGMLYLISHDLLPLGLFGR